ISNDSNEISSTLLIYKNHSNKEEIRKSYCDVIEVDNTSILLNFVEQGVGLGVIPNYLLKGSSHQELLKVTHTYSTEKS
ncbi:LysR family transcriptional regulator, partial [Vibrio parahaemolyticus]